jgi:aspartyl-tRNA(Asn)/glutamyl-tRNA(Gln) amidotransferase subunit B
MLENLCMTSIPPKSYIDLNRSGVGADGDCLASLICALLSKLVHISKKLRSILRYLGTCDGNMEEGSLRADVNVSVRRPGEGLGHAHRNQKPELSALYHAGYRL